MPTYEYACQACGHEWEAIQRMRDDALRDCPSCGKPKAKRQISAGTGFILKGGGWYSDLYGSSKKKSDGASPKAGSEGSNGAGSDAKGAPEKPAADKPKDASKD